MWAVATAITTAAAAKYICIYVYWGLWDNTLKVKGIKRSEGKGALKIEIFSGVVTGFN